MSADIYKQDRFYVDLDNEVISWMYHNPDAVSGDQFVNNLISFDLFKEALEKSPPSPESGFEPNPVYDYMGEHCRQYLSDRGDEQYECDKEMFETDPVSIGMTYATLEKTLLLFEAKKLINDYCQEEFGHDASFHDLKKVGIAYTTTEDDTHEIQVYANLIDHQTEFCFDGELVATQGADSLKDYVENRLPYLDFNELVDIPDWVIDSALKKGRYRDDLKFMQLNAWNQSFLTCIEVGTYFHGGGLAMDLYEVSEGDPVPFASITVNLPEYSPAPGCAFVDTNNFGAAEELIRGYSLGEPTGRIGHSGYCTYPEYRFDLKEIRNYCINPEEIDRILKPKNRERSDER